MLFVFLIHFSTMIAFINVYGEVFDNINCCTNLKVYLTLVPIEQVKVVEYHLAVIEGWVIIFGIWPGNTIYFFVEKIVIFILSSFGL